MEKHRHCPLCGKVMKGIGADSDFFDLFYCAEYLCRVVVVDFTTHNEVVVGKKIILANGIDIDERKEAVI
jgi:hypothetical protein